MVSSAIDTYLELAYGSASAPRKRPNLDLPASAGLDEILALFQRDVVADEGRSCVRYTMRLGNRNYPFMKLYLQEHIVPGEFYFGVDTHDDMEIKPDFPDYEAWMAVVRFNRDLKRSIEERFAEQDLHTAATLRRICEERAQSAVEQEGRTILVVDDEQDLADAVAALLRARGYEVLVAADGREGLELAVAAPPDLVLLDYELPELDGLEVIQELRDREETRGVPVLLCTASKIGVGEIRKADGFLAKPYHEDLLYEMVQRVLAAGGRAISR
jgi:CheY-like chemotaxis protein